MLGSLWGDRRLLPLLAIAGGFSSNEVDGVRSESNIFWGVSSSGCESPRRSLEESDAPGRRKTEDGFPPLLRREDEVDPPPGSAALGT